VPGRALLDTSAAAAFLRGDQALADRKRVLEYARTLSERTPRAVSGASLLPLAGSVPESDMAEIEAAIEEGCEKVNPGAW
jgi:hypothetical protein